jgi:hypothetical protein
MTRTLIRSRALATLLHGAMLLGLATPAFSQTKAEAPAPAATAPPYKLSGLMFGDYYAVVSQHLPAWEDQHGLWFRRMYFTYDHTFTPKLSTRFRLEANSNGKLAGGQLTPYIKDAYLKWNAWGRQALTVGTQPSLSFEYVESVWGLRHIEKTPLDLYRWDSSRDTGLTLSGPINGSQTLKYAVQYGNESGNSAETDKFKGYRAAARYERNPGFTVEATIAQFERDKEADRTIAQLFAGYRAKRGRVGGHYSFQRRRAGTAAPADAIDMSILSAWGVLDLQPRKTSAFLRVDRYSDPCADCTGIDYLPIDPKEKFTLVIAGVEYFLNPAVRVSPNIEHVHYGTAPAAAAQPGNDTVLRLTFFWTW